jgi:hypothetical protein
MIFLFNVSSNEWYLIFGGRISKGFPMPPSNDEQSKKDAALAELKVKLDQLQSFQHAIYEFLHIFCNYDIKERVQSFIAYSELVMRLGPLTHEQELFLTTARLNGEEIMRMIDVVRDTVAVERGDSVVLRHERVDLRQILMISVLQAQQKVEYDNKNNAHSLKLEKESCGSFRVAQHIDPITIQLTIPDDLPLVWINSWIVEHVVSDLTWFILEHQQKVEVWFSASFDDQQVTVTIGCFCFSVRSYIWEEFNHVDTLATPFALLSPEARSLYLARYRLRAYGADLSFELQDRTLTGEVSKAMITLTLPIYREEHAAIQ